MYQDTHVDVDSSGHRNMYYLDPNILQPLTKSAKLSFAEYVGPDQAGMGGAANGWGGGKRCIGCKSSTPIATWSLSFLSQILDASCTSTLTAR